MIGDNHTLKVFSSYNKDIIRTSVDYMHGDELVKNVMQQVVHLQDESIRQALIELGWTPPRKDSE